MYYLLIVICIYLCTDHTQTLQKRHRSRKLWLTEFLTIQGECCLFYSPNSNFQFQTQQMVLPYTLPWIKMSPSSAPVNPSVQPMYKIMMWIWVFINQLHQLIREKKQWSHLMMITLHHVLEYLQQNLKEQRMKGCAQDPSRTKMPLSYWKPRQFV